jgi:hypothetical protein
LFNSCERLTSSFDSEVTQSEETFPNLQQFHLEQTSAIVNPKFLYGMVAVFPNLNFVNATGSWEDVPDSYFIKAVQKSSDKRLLIMVEGKVFEDNDT